MDDQVVLCCVYSAAAARRRCCLLAQCRMVQRMRVMAGDVLAQDSARIWVWHSGMGRQTRATVLSSTKALCGAVAVCVMEKHHREAADICSVIATMVYQILSPTVCVLCVRAA